jgi:hypothetical protein
MNLAEIEAVMMRGCCSRHRIAETGCATCEPVIEAVGAVKEIHARMVRAEEQLMGKPAYIIIDDPIAHGKDMMVHRLLREHGIQPLIARLDIEHRRGPFHSEDLMGLLRTSPLELDKLPSLLPAYPPPPPLRYKTILAIVAVLRGARA